MLARIVDWARGCADVDALVLTGSLARGDSTADAWSDIDVEIISPSPERFLARDRWINEFGEVAIVMRLDGDEHHPWPTRLVLYADGVRVDFTLADAQRVTGMIESRQLDALYARGYAVLIDKRGQCESLPPPSPGPQSPSLPTQVELSEVTGQFWFEATHVPKYLARGELWLASSRHWAMLCALVHVAQWHALAHGKPPVDVWYGGRGVSEWLAPEHRNALASCFGGFNTDDIQRAFEATIELFVKLGRELATTAGLSFPEGIERSVRSHLNATDPRRNKTPGPGGGPGGS
ncbi:MAG: aminoglycoside 6-adenylyltransferase [Phycisphaerales bacterium]|nr:aminoglycoside 6-adenylyltransferase [Phycisphaerales bacterium]